MTEPQSKNAKRDLRDVNRTFLTSVRMVLSGKVPEEWNEQDAAAIRICAKLAESEARRDG